MGLPSCKPSHTSTMVRTKRPKIHAFRNRASGFSILRFPGSVNLQLATSRDSTEELPLDPGLFVTLDTYESALVAIGPSGKIRPRPGQEVSSGSEERITADVL